jgi:TolB-like protein/tetratricopeptide (TPR) repeat protein
MPSTVDRAIIKAMAKDPADRYATVAEFLGALHAPVPAMPRTAARTRSIAVLPFVNVPDDSETEYLSDGITDELIVALAKVSGLRVASRTSVFALKGKPQDVRAIGVLLGVSVVLEGSVRRLGDRLRITAQLTATDTGQAIWSQRYDRTMGDLFALQDEMATTIVNTLRATSFADLSESLPRRYTDNVKAYALYLRGRHAWNKRTQEGVLEGAGYFERAIAADPNYALAYTGLSDSYALQVDYRDVPVLEGFQRAKSYARQALAIDDALAEAHASLAWTLFIYDWDWDAATQEFRRAIELDPRYATAHQWFSFLLLSQGHIDESLLEAHTALELDPASVSVRRSLAHAYYYARRYDQAIYHIERAIALDPTAAENHRLLGMFLTLQERHEEAVGVLRDAVEMSGGSAGIRAMLGYALARAGHVDETRAILEDLEARSRHGYISSVVFINLHLALRDWDRALDAMDRAYAERRGWMVYLNVNPMLDPVREHPRFREIVKRMKLG